MSTYEPPIAGGVPIPRLVEQQRPDTEQKPVSGLWIALYTLAYIGFWLAALTPGIIGLPLKITTMVGQEAAPAALGVVAATGTFIGLITTPVFGRLSDLTTSRFGMRRPWLITLPILGVLGGVICGFAPNVAVLALGYSVVAIGFNGAYAALAPVVADQVPTRQRGLVSGLVGISLPVALVGGTFAVQLIVTHPTLPLIVPAVIGAVLVIVFGLFLKDRHLRVQDRPSASWKSLPGTFWVSPRRAPDFAWAWAGRFMLVLAYALLTLYQTFFLLDQLGTPLADVANQVFIATVVLSITTAISSVLGGRLSDRIRRRKPFVIGSAVIYGIALIVVAFATSFEGFLIGIAIAGIGFGAYAAVDIALATEVLPDKNDVAKDLGVFNIASTLPQTLAPAIAPIILGLGAGNYSVLFAVAGGLAVLSAFAIFPIKSVR